MMTKTAYYMQMAQEAAAQITGSKEQWTAFLTTSARLYKYPFAEQLMIYKQRPEATACAEYDLWNDRMNRYVKRGSKGIALLDMRGEQPKLRYVFDVADTGERKNSRPVQLWKMNAEHEQPIIRALDVAFDVPAGAGSLENHIMEAAERLARDYWEENRRQISDIVADSYLEGYDELNIGASFKRAAAVSIAYSVFTRTVGNADDYFEHEDFLDIFDFNTQAAANVLGTAVSEMSSQIFREIERTIRTYEREKQAERSQNYDGAELHEERRLPDSGHPVVGAGTEAAGQVREDAQSVPAGEQHAAVQSPDPDREAVSAPVGDSGDRDRTDGADDGGASESESGTGQEIEPNGLGAAHEHAESAGRGSHSDGTYQQLNFMSLFQSEAEQIQKIDAAAENAAREAESEKPSAFVISENEIDRMLRAGSNFEGGKIRIYALYQQQGDAKERAAFLKAEYGLGGHSYTFTHVDRAHIHNHIIFNSTTLDCTRKFRDFRLSGLALARLSDIVCLEHRLSVIVRKPYGERKKRTEYPEKKSQRDEICEAIDAALERKPKDFQELIGILQEAGYEYKDGKQPALRGKGHARFARFRSLGKGYSVEELCGVIAGNAVHKSKFAEKTRTSARSAQVHQKAELSFLIDVRAKMQAGKGAGYARWAKVFNLKQMAKAMMFMEEHGIKNYAELKEKADGISEKCDALLESVKADEARMSEVSVLRKHLINYAKTKDVFAAYKASGYDREFYEAHRDMLALRSAAKKAFDAYKKENGSDKKLPRISELNAEYAMLLERKKSSYAEYRKTKSEMQDWLVAQKIVQEILKEDEQKKEQLHEQEVRQEEENRQNSR